MELYDVRILRREWEEYHHLAEMLPHCETVFARALEQKLRRQSEKLAEILWKIAKFIEGIEDPELRLIFELRYFRGLDWQRVAAGLPTMLSADGARMKHHRYLKKSVAHDGSRVCGLVICP